MSRPVATISTLPAECLLHIFQDLPLREVIRCGRVCKSWRDLTKYQKLRRNVSLSHLNIVNWEKAAELFQTWKTTAIDFSDSLDKCNDNLQWKKLSKFLRELKPQLRCLRFQMLRIDVLECIFSNCKDLQGLCVELLSSTAEHPEDFLEYFDIGKIRNLQELRELHINLDYETISNSYFSFYGGLNSLKNIKHLRILRLTSFMNLQSYEFGFLPKLSELVEVQLGDLAILPPEAFSALAEVKKLRKLSLMNGECECQTITYCQCIWPEHLSKLVNLVELELDRVRIVPKLNRCLRRLIHLKELKILPLLIDFVPDWKTSFTAKDVKKNNVADVVMGLPHLQKLTWEAWCPSWKAETEEEGNKSSEENKRDLDKDSVTDSTGMLIALKDMLQVHLPRTEILVIPVIDTES